MRLRESWLMSSIVLALAGCGQATRVDTGPVEVAFEMVPATNRVILEAAIADIDAGRLREAIAGFREMERKYRLNPRQELAVKVVLRDLERLAPSPTPPTAVTNTPLAAP